MNSKTHFLRLHACSVLFALAIGAVSAGSAQAQTDLGGQRVATSSGTFLKIGLDARGAALGGCYNAIVEGPVATFYNPAGLLAGHQGQTLQVALVQWPADLQINAISYSRPFAPIGGRIGFGFAYLGAEMNETTEFYPQGTGRTAGYSDMLATFSMARAFTDKLNIGVTLKYLREDMASNIGGPLIHGYLIDAGTIYFIGYRNSRLAVTLVSFGPDLHPDGRFRSSVRDTDVDYSSFSPPTQFQLAFALDPWNAGPHRLTSTIQVLHQADNAETVRGGFEYWYDRTYALRSGYDFTADDMRFSAGLGVQLMLGDRRGTFDYAFTEGGHLEAVHRWSLGISF